MTGEPTPALLKAEMHLLIRGFIPAGDHCHAHDEILLPLTGSYRSRVGEQELELAAGQAIWYPAGLLHRPIESACSAEVRLLYAAFHCPPDWRPTATEVAVVDDLRARLQSTLWWMSELTLRQEARADIQAGRLLAILLGEFALLATDGQGEDRFQALLTFIDRQLRAPLTVGEMARFLGVGCRQLERKFQQRCGCTPKAWLRRRRLEKAIHLRACGQTLKEIAPQVGIRSLAHLSRLLGGAPHD